MSELEVEQCVKMLELAQVVDHEKLDAWHKVFAKHKLSFEVVSMAMTHLTLVLPKYRKECFELFGFSPDVGTFSDWVVRGRFDFSLARTQSWLHNGQLDYAYEGGDFLVMVDGVVPEKQCCDIWRYYHSKALLGPASATALKLPDCEQRESEVQKVGESVHVSEMPKLEDPVDESENQVLERGSVRTVTEPEKLFPGDMHDMLHLESIEQDNAGITHSGTKYKDVEAVDAQVELGDAVAEASYVSAFLLLYQEEYRAKVHETCGFAPTLLSLVSAEFPMVSMDRLKGFRLVADGDTFEVGRNNSRFRGSACDVLNVLSYVCTVNTGVKDIRLKFDGVDYSGLQSGESLDWLESKYIRLVFEEPVLTVLRANGKSEEHMALGLVDNDWLDAVEPSLRVGLQHAMEFQPGFESFLRMVGARFVEYGLESGLQSTGSVNTCRNVVYVRYRGAGADSVLDAVWTGVETDGVSGPNYPWFRRVVFGNGLPDGKHQLLQTRWVSAVDVPLGVRRGYPLDGRGCSFLRMAFSHDVSHEVNPQLSELWDRVVAHGHGVVEKVDYLGKLVIPKDSLVLVSSERIVKLMRGMLRDMGVAGCCTVSTVAGASGLTAENVVVVDFGEEMFRDDVAACMVAVTRHTVKLQYAGVTLLGGLIREFVERNSCL